MSEATITSKLRLVSRDFGQTFEARIVGDGTIRRYDLPVGEVDPAVLVVSIDNGTTVTVLARNTDGNMLTNEYTLDEHVGVVTLWAPLALNDILTATGTGYVVLPADASSFVNTAFSMHTEGVLPAPTMDTLSSVEEYLVALLAFKEILWSLIAEAAREVNVDTPEGMHIPEGQRFQQLLAMVQHTDDEYRSIASQLNVGLYRIEVFSLRRVSRTTNRLVPLWVAQEFDDTSPPVRVLPRIDTGGPVAP